MLWLANMILLVFNYCNRVMKRNNRLMGHFWVTLCLWVKTSLREKPFIWKCVPPIGSFSCKLNSFSHERFCTRTRFETEAKTIFYCANIAYQTLFTLVGIEDDVCLIKRPFYFNRKRPRWCGFLYHNRTRRRFERQIFLEQQHTKIYKWTEWRWR